MAAPMSLQVHTYYTNIQRMFQHQASLRYDRRNRLPFNEADVLLASQFLLNPAANEMSRLRIRYGLTAGENVEYRHHWWPLQYRYDPPEIDDIFLGVSRRSISEKGPLSKTKSAVRPGTNANPIVLDDSDEKQLAASVRTTTNSQLRPDGNRGHSRVNSRSRTSTLNGRRNSVSQQPGSQQDTRAHPAVRPQQNNAANRSGMQHSQHRNPQSQAGNHNSCRNEAQPPFTRNVDVWIGWSRDQIRFLTQNNRGLDEQSTRKNDCRVAVVARFDDRGYFQIIRTPYNMDNLCVREVMGVEQAVQLPDIICDVRAIDDSLQFEEVILAPGLQQLNRESLRLEVARRSNLPPAKRLSRHVANPANMRDLLY